MKAQHNNSIPIAYAVTYIFGTVVFAWFFLNFGPKILRIDIAKECKDYEAKLGEKMDEPGVLPAMQLNALRAIKITSGKFANRKVSELKKEIGEEVYDPELIDFKVEILDVFMSDMVFVSLGILMGGLVGIPR